MKLIIDITENTYNEIHKYGLFMNPISHTDLEYALINATPLPKGHGRLIDADELDKDLERAQVHLEDETSMAFDDGLIWASEVLNDAPTIIEADNERGG